MYLYVQIDRETDEHRGVSGRSRFYPLNGLSKDGEVTGRVFNLQSFTVVHTLVIYL